MRFNLIFFISSLVVLCYSCGFANQAGQNAFKIASRSGAGDGETPTLKSRILDNPQLAEEDCEDNDRCKETCGDMYPDRDSRKDCYSLNIQQVSNIENVFYALVNADSEELKDIDADHLEDYLKIGLDSWLERVIEKQSGKYPRFSNILKWIVTEEKDVIPLLEREDSQNEILEQIVLNYCDVKEDGRCEYDKSANPHEESPTPNHNNFPTGSCALKITGTKPGNDDRFPPTPDCSSSPYYCPILSSSHFADYSIFHVTDDTESGVFAEGERKFDYSNKKSGVVFDYANAGGLYYCSRPSTQPPGNCPDVTPDNTKTCTTLTHKKLAEIEDDDNKKLFMSLVGVGRVFFNHAAENTKPSAFALGHKLLEKACDNRDRDSLIQCMSVFYCWLNAHNKEHENKLVDDDDHKDIASGATEKSFLENNDIKAKIDLRVTDLEQCDYSSNSFTKL